MERGLPTNTIFFSTTTRGSTLTSLTKHLVIEESESLVDVGKNPGVGVDVEAVNHLESEQTRFVSLKKCWHLKSYSGLLRVLINHL